MTESKQTTEDKQFKEFMENYQLWTHSQVIFWLKLNGYAKYESEFKRNQIDGIDLVTISVNDLMDIGLSRFDARSLFRDISNLTVIEFEPKSDTQSFNVLVDLKETKSDKVFEPIAESKAKSNSLKRLISLVGFK
jgi:hypothetical protein